MSSKSTIFGSLGGWQEWGEQTVDYIVRHEAVQKMRVGPSESACRS